MTALKALLVTLGVVLTGVGSAAIVLVAAWLIGSYGVDRMLQIVSILIGMAGILFPLVLHFRRRR